MIQARENIVWVEADNGELTPFDDQRLVESIQRAAALANHLDWWLAESIAAAIHLYAVEYLPQRAITADEVSEIAVGVLAMLGFDEVSQAYARRGERTEIRLDEIVTQASGGFELGFFRQLDTALQAARDEDLSVVRVCGLRTCVMRLRGAHRWGASCRQLAEDIVDYVRCRVSRMRPERAAALRLAVLE
jgi:hypothetical protein